MKGEGRREGVTRRGNAGWGPPQHPRCVAARLRRNPRCSQRIAAIVNRGKHRVTSGGPRLRYKILPRVTRCSPPEETRGFSRPAARYSIRRARGTIAWDNGEPLRRQGCVKPRRNAGERNLLSFIMRPLQRASGMCGDLAFFILIRTLWRGYKKKSCGRE